MISQNIIEASQKNGLSSRAMTINLPLQNVKDYLKSIQSLNLTIKDDEILMSQLEQF